MPHDHKYTIADDQAVHVLLDKMLGGGTRRRRREKLLKALEEASRHYQNSSGKEHPPGLLSRPPYRLRGCPKALVRIVLDWEAVIAGWVVPRWVSWVALVIAGYLGYEGLRLSKR